MTYDNQVTLIRLIGEDPDGNPYTDEHGNHVPQEARRDILCGERSVRSQEFYQAHALGLHPEFALIVHRYEYEGEIMVEYQGKQYSVVRTFSSGIEEIELYVEERQGVTMDESVD